ncbi:MAG: heavy-metal-associated domain-containing protein [Hyphomicrobiales bacterium]|uniref:heavy-metal-associated domain-containing protein n=1 Tax=Rhabdaerophilum calidifontis TaxID=2604328 RepID=UPI00123AF1E5|nr:heavy-metal-associated domain-containing protein [Rhabdaerophilum calidifontis]MCA1951442.1 heavy-metal-associated domain-containing protein [Hyphomicrobiales bacterium]MCA1998207.1 heavy-metal-associated domain-containing protein [Hyphomicrobiales bacterium]
MSETIEIKVDGMGCQSCVAAVERAVKGAAPAAEVAIDLASGQVRIAHAGAARETLIRAIEAAGYDVVSPAPAR